jgi:hypothetical protein
MGSRTYYVKYTWENDTGETLASSEANITVGANQLLKITHPYTSTYGPPSGAKKINWYVSTSTNTETKQDYTWLSWAEEEALYPIVQTPDSWTEPTTGLISGAALPGANTTNRLTMAGIFEVSGGTMIYPNIYEGNDFKGLTGDEIYSSSSSYKRIQRSNYTTRDLTFNGAAQILERIPYAKGNITGSATFDPWYGETQTATFTGNVTATMSNGHYVGQVLERRFTMGGAGSYAYTKAANERLAGGAFSPSATVGKFDILIQEWDGTYWVEKRRTMGLA